MFLIKCPVNVNSFLVHQWTAYFTDCLTQSENYLQHETPDANLAPDGYYVPRIIFVGKFILKQFVKYNHMSVKYH